MLALWLGYGELRRSGSSGAAAVRVLLAVLALGVAPVYLLWETPEILNLALVTAGLVAFRRGRPLLAALALGLAVYSKPTHLAAALPLLLAPLVGAGAGVAAPRRWNRRAAWGSLAAVAAACFGLGWLATGELNYQGGERKTFYDRYPFDPGVSFDSAGVWMTTDHVGPLVAGRDDDEQSDRVAPPRAPEELRRSFLLNLGYFWVGRFGGALPYFPGFAAALALFLAVGPRERDGWLALAARRRGVDRHAPASSRTTGTAAPGRSATATCSASLPLGLLLLPRGRGLAAAAVSRRSSRAGCCCRCSASPVRHSLQPGAHATRPAFRLLPAELTMLSDLSVFTDVWRKRRPYAPAGGRRPTSSGSSTTAPSGRRARSARKASGCAAASGPRSCCRRRARPRACGSGSRPARRGDIVTAGSAARASSSSCSRSRRRSWSSRPRARSLGYYGTSLYRLQLGSRFGGADRHGRAPVSARSS